MIGLGEHAEFIAAAYVGVALVTLGLIVMVVLDARRQKARLRQLEAQGVRRRSEGGQ